MIINFIYISILLFKIEEEEGKLEAAVEEIEKQNAEVNAELKELELKSVHFEELEERYVLFPTVFHTSFLACL